MPYGLSALAEQDLEHIWLYVAEDASPTMADRLIDADVQAARAPSTCSRMAVARERHVSDEERVKLVSTMASCPFGDPRRRRSLVLIGVSVAILVYARTATRQGEIAQGRRRREEQKPDLRWG